jgi:hypothetical protein
LLPTLTMAMTEAVMTMTAAVLHSLDAAARQGKLRLMNAP